VTTSNIEKSSIDWKEIRRRYEQERCSVRALAREHETTDTAIHRRAKSEGWKLFSTTSAPQRGVQQPEKKPRPWSFETRRDALVTGLERSRASVDNSEDSYYCDALVVQALLWFRTPVAEIARAIEITEAGLEEIYGVQIFKHWRDVEGIKLSRNAQRRVERADLLAERASG
jgi:hypothetical protein